MILLSYLYFWLSARQWWVFVFIGDGMNTGYLEKGANISYTAVGNILHLEFGLLALAWIWI